MRGGFVIRAVISPAKRSRSTARALPAGTSVCVATSMTKLPTRPSPAQRPPTRSPARRNGRSWNRPARPDPDRGGRRKPTGFISNRSTSIPAWARPSRAPHPASPPPIIPIFSVTIPSCSCEKELPWPKGWSRSMAIRAWPAPVRSRQERRLGAGPARTCSAFSASTTAKARTATPKIFISRHGPASTAKKTIHEDIGEPACERA